MINSSYLVASDPNSMRDCGPTRNCEFVYSIPARTQTADRKSRTASKRDTKEFYELAAPISQKVADYTKNISASIFSPACDIKDFHSIIPKEVRDKHANKFALVREPRGSSAGWHAYDPFEPNLRDKDRIDRINLLKDQIE